MAPIPKVSVLVVISLLASSAAASTAANASPYGHDSHLRMRRHHDIVKVEKRLLGTIGGLENDINGIVGGLAGTGGLIPVRRVGTDRQPMERGLVGSIIGIDDTPPSGDNGHNGGSSSPASSSHVAAHTSQAAAPSPRPSAAAPQSSTHNDGGSSSAESNTRSSGGSSNSSSAPSNNGGSNNGSTSGQGNANTAADNGSSGSNQSGSSSNSNGNDGNNSSNNNKNSNSDTTGGNSNNSNKNAASSPQNPAPTSNSGPSNGDNQQANAAAYSASAASAVSAALVSTNAPGPSTATLSESAIPTSTGRSSVPGTGATTGTSDQSRDSTGGGDGGGGSDSTKIVVPIVVVAATLALCAVGWTLYKRAKKAQQGQHDPRMRPIDFEPSHGPAGGHAAFAVGGASAGGFGARRRDSDDSFGAARPMSTLSEETHKYDDAGPPMQEVAAPVVFQAVGSAYGDPASTAAAPSSRMHNYGRGYNDQRESMAPSELSAAGYGQYSIDDEGYDVNYYDGSSRVGYTSSAATGMDAAGAKSAGGRGYSPYADLQRGGSLTPSQDDPYAEDSYDDYRSGRGSSRRAVGPDPFDD